MGRVIRARWASVPGRRAVWQTSVTGPDSARAARRRRRVSKAGAFELALPARQPSRPYLVRLISYGDDAGGLPGPLPSLPVLSGGGAQAPALWLRSRAAIAHPMPSLSPGCHIAPRSIMRKSPIACLATARIAGAAGWVQEQGWHTRGGESFGTAPGSNRKAPRSIPRPHVLARCRGWPGTPKGPRPPLENAMSFASVCFRYSQ